jgi:hypothetical protein
VCCLGIADFIITITCPHTFHYLEAFVNVEVQSATKYVPQSTENKTTEYHYAVTHHFKDFTYN